MTEAVIGVDVGTGSARAGVFDLAGHRLGMAVRPIRIWRPHPDHVEQSADDIWAAVCAAVREALAQARAPAVRGIGFDATCSLVLRDAEGRAVPVNDDMAERDVIVWMDHRATGEAERINQGGHAVLRYVGGVISPEMQTPKLLWLKHNLPENFARTRRFFDLPDFLTWRATGADSRSLCSTACKWTYLGHERRWDAEYFRAIGLGELADEGFRRLGTEMLASGAPVGAGVSDAAAAELGVPARTPVGASAIDAHAGGIGVIGAGLQEAEPAMLRRRMALIGGTSSCHMAVSAEPVFVPGVWGPYYAAMLPELWLNEGGQSATGGLLDHVVQTHAAYVALQAEADDGVYERLNELLEQHTELFPFPAAATAGLHIYPDFHGNRSPLADPTMRGMISGLSLSAGLAELVLLYLATVQAVAYGTRQIVEAMNQAGYAIDTICATGGGSRNPVFLREHADATGCRIVLGDEREAVLLGAAMLGAVAGGCHADVPAAMRAMARAGRVVEPGPDAVRRFHDAKYAVFRRMQADQRDYRGLMA